MSRKIAVDESKLQNWISANIPDDRMLWHNAWGDRVCFMRDRLIHLFNDDYDIVGEHYSKSILNPVIKTLYKGVEIIWQYNFYYWQIMIKSSFSIRLKNLDLYNATGNYFYYQGIPDEYCFEKYSFKNNNKEFAVCVNDDLLDVWAFAIELKHCIDRHKN